MKYFNKKLLDQKNDKQIMRLAVNLYNSYRDLADYYKEGYKTKYNNSYLQLAYELWLEFHFYECKRNSIAF